MDRATLKDCELFYEHLIEDVGEWNAPENLVGHLLDLGYDSSEAHSALCTIQTLYDAGAKIK